MPNSSRNGSPNEAVASFSLLPCPDPVQHHMRIDGRLQHLVVEFIRVFLRGGAVEKLGLTLIRVMKGQTTFLRLLCHARPPPLAWLGLCHKPDSLICKSLVLHSLRHVEE